MRAEDNAKFVYFLVALNILPHSVELPQWVIVAGLTFVLWKYASEHFNIPTPNKWMIHGLGLLMGFGVFAEYGTIMGDEASASVLVMAVSLKLFEVKKYRDIMIVTILCYFLLMSKLISSQTIAMTIFMLVDLVLITSLLALHHSPVDQGNAKALIRRSFRLAILSSPIVLSLFFVFPRFNMGLGNNTQRNLAEMGFSDSLNPGSVAELMQSDQLIFRARFPNGDQLAPSQLYWRGAVLSYVDGLRWGRGAVYQNFSRFRRGTKPPAGSIETEIHMEPQSGKNLFVLDWPSFVKFPDDWRNYRVKKYPHQIYESRTPFVKREYYRVYSQVETRQVVWEPYDNETFLNVAGEVSEDVKQLVERLDPEKRLSAADKVRKIYDYYTENRFAYSLKNPNMSTVDDFLFRARQGFCEHYAGVTAYLLRLMGVPSRVIVGFQGGSESFLGDYLSIRALDAHAWLEYYDEERSGWVRLDPTVVVAPLRIAGGAEEFLDDLGEERGDVQWMKDWFGDGVTKNYFAMMMVFDQIDASWSNFLLKYDFEYQKDILKELGLSTSARWLLAGLTALFLVLFLGLLLIIFSRQRSRGDRISEIYWRLLKKIHRAGVTKDPSEGPANFADRAIMAFPSRKEELENVFLDILDYRYSREPVTRAQLKDLKSRVRKLKISEAPLADAPQRDATGS